MGSCLCCSKKTVSSDTTAGKPEPESVSDFNTDTKEETFGTAFSDVLSQHSMSILLVFSKDDKQCLAFQQAAELANYQCSVVKSMESILSSWIELSPNVIIVDARNSRTIESLCKTFTTLTNREGIVLVAVREAVVMTTSVAKPSDTYLHPLIRAGFTRQFIENFNINACLAELRFIDNGELQSRFQFQLAISFVSAVENANDSIEITDSKNNIMFVNGAFERLFGYTKRETIGKTFLTAMNCSADKNAAVIETIKSEIKRGRMWKGSLKTCNKSDKVVSHRCCVIPILEPSGEAQSVVAIRRVFGAEGNIVQKGNSQTRTAGRNRSTTLIEAPMTKAIKTINRIQETCPPNIAESLDNVLEMLKLTELYGPIKVDDVDNQMTQELLEGLMTAPTIRRTSMNTSVSGMQEFKSRSSDAGITSCLMKVPLIGYSHATIKAQALLIKDNKWDFNILELEKLTDQKPLQYLAMKIFERFNVIENLKIDQQTLVFWLRVIESHYHSSNPFHNSTHAADVLHAAAYFLSLDSIKDKLDPDQKISVLIASVIHDVDHPGKTNSYLINSNSYLALLYNDVSILENHHASFAFRLTQQDASINIFKNLEKDDYRSYRMQIIDMVLATELSKHAEHLSRFMHNVVDHRIGTRRQSIIVPTGSIDHADILKRMLIKCADASNVARPRQLSIAWAERVAEEYFQQTDDERAKGLPIVMPMFDRHFSNLPKLQISFINLFINDMFDVWTAFCDIPDLMEQIRSNFEYWEDMDKKNSDLLALKLSVSQPATPKTPPTRPSRRSQPQKTEPHSSAPERTV